MGLRGARQPRYGERGCDAEGQEQHSGHGTSGDRPTRLRLQEEGALPERPHRALERSLTSAAPGPKAQGLAAQRGRCEGAPGSVYGLLGLHSPEKAGPARWSTTTRRQPLGRSLAAWPVSGAASGPLESSPISTQGKPPASRVPFRPAAPAPTRERQPRPPSQRST